MERAALDWSRGPTCHELTCHGAEEWREVDRSDQTRSRETT